MGLRALLVVGVVALLVGCDDDPSLIQDKLVERPQDTAAIEGSLKKLASGASVSSFTVTYSDLHGLHGGLELAITGDGKVTQTAVRTEVGEPRAVKAEELAALAKLLLEQKAWEQRVEPRMAVPDESKATLGIAIDGQRSKIWEWYDDLKANKRIQLIADRMREIAWAKKPAK